MGVGERAQDMVRVCNCTIPLTNPDACKSCPTGQSWTESASVGSRRFEVGQGTPIGGISIPYGLTPDRVREIVREELAVQKAQMVANAGRLKTRVLAPVAKTDDQLRMFISQELRKYSVEIDEKQLADFIKETIEGQLKADYIRHLSQADWLDIKNYVDKKFKTEEIEFSDEELDRFVDNSVMPKVAGLIDKRIRAALASLSRLVAQV
jgi:hypothetical protein